MSEQPKDGATCRTHSDRHASFQCELCDRAYCVFCYHPVFKRCQACLERDPSAAAPQLPFEDTSTPALPALVRTMGTAFSPARSAPAFAQGTVRSAFAFFLLTAIPLSLISGIIPYTRHLRFGDLAVELISHPTSADITVDIVRAMGIQLALHMAFIGGLMMPYVSLLKAYGTPAAATVAKRLVLYRAWLVPAATLLTGLLGWVMPAPAEGASPGAGFVIAVNVVQILPVLLLLAMGFVARFSAGVGRGWAIALVTVAVLISFCTSTVAAMILLSAAPPLGL